ncbi:MAG TPA: hypothetical protein VKE51_22220 [Vicinamibacterales bacterium]|nr:hypothetical protein [Vicinamibacterales bacterium]
MADGYVAVIRVAIVAVVSAVAERLKTGSHGWLEIRLIRNSEQDKREGYQAARHEAAAESETSDCEAAQP